MSSIKTRVIDFFPNQFPYFQKIIDNTKQFCYSPLATYNSWNTKQRAIFLGTSSIISLYILSMMKYRYSQYKLAQQGFRKGDLTTQGWELLQELGASPTVCGFEVCPDSYTFDDTKHFIKEMMKSFINFRSQIYKIGNEWYFKEEFDPETQDYNDYVTYIPLECKEISDEDSNEIIEEKIFQQVIKYLNERNAFNVKWNTYKRGHIDGFYFHFKSIKKCIIYIRLNHSLGDGILISTLVGLIQNKLHNPLFKDTDIDFSKPDEIMPLITNILGNKVPNFGSYWKRILWYYATAPFAWMKLVYQLVTNKPDTECVFRGPYAGKNQLAIAAPIPVDKFKSVAKQNGGTVNDLFLTLAFGACQRYAKKYECPIFNDDNFDGVFGKVGIINRRPLTPVKFAKELETFSKYGTNSNAIDFTPIYVSFKNVSIKQSQRSFAEIKYGYRPQAIRSLMEIVVNTIPNGIDYLFSDFGNAVTLATSNLKGPSALIPVPAYDNANEDKKEDDKVNNVNEYVSWLWGMGVPAMMPMSFTLLTYNKHVRIGVMTDAGSVKEPNKLMECFMEEWDQYNIIQ